MSRQTIDLRPLQEWADGFAERMAKVVGEIAAQAARNVINTPLGDLDKQADAPEQACDDQETYGVYPKIEIRTHLPRNPKTCVLCGEIADLRYGFVYRGYVVHQHQDLRECIGALRERLLPLEAKADGRFRQRIAKVRDGLFFLPPDASHMKGVVGDHIWAGVIVSLRARIDELEREMQGSNTAAHTPDAYQEQVLRTWMGGKDKRDEIQHAALGLGGELGEFLDLIKKNCYKPDYVLSPEKAKDELSDVVYYVLIMAHLWGFTFQDMMDHLAVKLDDGHGWVAK